MQTNCKKHFHSCVGATDISNRFSRLSGRIEAKVLKFLKRKGYSRNRAFDAHDALRKGFADLGANFEEIDSTIYFALHREAMALGGDKAIENFKIIFKEVWQRNESA